MGAEYLEGMIDGYKEAIQLVEREPISLVGSIIWSNLMRELSRLEREYDAAIGVD